MSAMQLNVGSIFTVLVLTLGSGVEGISSYYIEDSYLDRVNTEYIDVNNSYVDPVWFNSTYSAISINITTIKALPRGTMGHFNVLEKTNGGYNTPSGISISQPWCKILKDPFMTAYFVTAMNLTQCPTPAGTYAVAEFRLPRMPSCTLPGTQYKISALLRNTKTIFIQMIILLSLY